MANRNVLGQVSGQYVPQLAYPADTFRKYFTQTPFSYGGAAFAPTQDLLYYTAIFIRETCNIVGLHTRVIGSAAVGATFRLGIYSALADGRPGSLLVDAGTVDASTTGFKGVAISALTVVPGLYWSAFVLNGASGPTTYNSDYQGRYQVAISTSTQAHASRNWYGTVGHVGALPSVASITNPDTGNSAPHIVLERQ